MNKQLATSAMLQLQTACCPSGVEQAAQGPLSGWSKGRAGDVQPGFDVALAEALPSQSPDDAARPNTQRTTRAVPEHTQRGDCSEQESAVEPSNQKSGRQLPVQHSDEMHAYQQGLGLHCVPASPASGVTDIGVVQVIEDSSVADATLEPVGLAGTQLISDQVLSIDVLAGQSVPDEVHDASLGAPGSLPNIAGDSGDYPAYSDLAEPTRVQSDVDQLSLLSSNDMTGRSAADGLASDLGLPQATGLAAEDAVISSAVSDLSSTASGTQSPTGLASVGQAYDGEYPLAGASAGNDLVVGDTRLDETADSSGSARLEHPFTRVRRYNPEQRRSLDGSVRTGTEAQPTGDRVNYGEPQSHGASQPRQSIVADAWPDNQLPHDQAAAAQHKTGSAQHQANSVGNGSGAPDASGSNRTVPGNYSDDFGGEPYHGEQVQYRSHEWFHAGGVETPTGRMLEPTAVSRNRVEPMADSRTFAVRTGADQYVVEGSQQSEAQPDTQVGSIRARENSRQSLDLLATDTVAANGVGARTSEGIQERPSLAAVASRSSRNPVLASVSRTRAEESIVEPNKVTAVGDSETTMSQPTLGSLEQASTVEVRPQIAGETIAGPVQSHEPTSSHSVVDQIVSRVNIEVGSASQKVTIGLQPESLGSVEVQLELEDGRVVASLAAETAETRRILRVSADQLVDALKAQGLEVTEVRITESQTAQLNLRYDDLSNEFAQGQFQDTNESGSHMTGFGQSGQRDQGRPYSFYRPQTHVAWSGHGDEAFSEASGQLELRA